MTLLAGMLMRRRFKKEWPGLAAAAKKVYKATIKGESEPGFPRMTPAQLVWFHNTMQIGKEKHR